MQPAGAFKHGLFTTQHLRQEMDERRIHQGRISRQNRTAHGLQRFDGSFAADSATGRSVEMALQPLEIHLDVGIKLHSNRIAGLSRIPVALGAPDLLDLLEALKNTLGEKESSSQLEIVAGSPHRKRDGFRANTN